MSQSNLLSHPVSRVTACSYFDSVVDPTTLPDLELTRDYHRSQIIDPAPPPTHVRSGSSFRPREADDDRDQTCNPDSCSSSHDRPASLTAIHTTGPSPPTALCAPMTDAFHYLTQLPCPDPTTTNDEGSAPQTPVQAHPTMAKGIQQHNAHRHLSAPSVRVKLCPSYSKSSSDPCVKKSLQDGIKSSMSVDDGFDIIFLHDDVSYNGDRIAIGPAREISTRIELDLAYSIEKVSPEGVDPEKSRTGGSLSPSASSVKNQISFQQHVRSQMQPTHQTHISLGVSPTKVVGQTALQLISTVSSNVYFGTILLDMYCRLGMVDAASQVFDSISERNVGSWTAIISGLAQHDHAKEGLVLFNKMRLTCVEPNEYTMGSILSACSLLDVLLQERWNQGYVLKKSMSMNSFIGSALWNVYSKCGKVELASQVFDRMKEIDIETWTAMIMGWAVRGCWKEALQCFEDMKCSCIKPDERAFLAILVACSHAGKVDKGLESFYSMRSRYQIEHGIKHYTCTVDMYGKAGMVNEALKFLNSMSIEPDYVFWRALLSACKANKNVEIVELAAERLLRLRPLHTGSQVFISNMYAGAGMWDDVENVRSSLKKNNQSKVPGWSYIEVDWGKPHHVVILKPVFKIFDPGGSLSPSGRHTSTESRPFCRLVSMMWNILANSSP